MDSCLVRAPRVACVLVVVAAMALLGAAGAASASSSAGRAGRVTARTLGTLGRSASMGPKAPPPVFSTAATQARNRPAAQQCLIAYQRYGACYDYAGGSQTGNNQGATVSFPVERPVLAWNGYHSLMEMAIFNRTPKGIDEDTAEIGWIIFPEASGQPPEAQLFIYHFVNTKGTCYNGCGFVSTSKTVKPGMVLQPGTTTWGIHNIAGKWAFYLDGKEFGYIPDSAYKGTFGHASMVEVYGEIAGQGTTPGCTQMGDSLYAHQPGAASIGAFRRYGGIAGPHLLPYYPTDPAAWTDTTAVNNYQVGGPGDCKPIAGTVAGSDGGYTVIGQNTAAYSFAPGQNVWTRPATPPPPQVPGAGQIVSVTSDPATGGYWMTDDQGDVYAINAPDYGGVNGNGGLTGPIVGITAFRKGYLLVTSTGQVLGVHAPTYGGLGFRPSSPAVGIAGTKTGYLIATSAGKVYNVHTPLYGSLRQRPRFPITGIATVGKGYLLVSTHGWVYNFHSPFRGSLRGIAVPKPIIGITPVGAGYVLTSSVGSVYAFNTAFDGSVTNEGI
jgi:Neprosin